jgi:hypothetical protein
MHAAAVMLPLPDDEADADDFYDEDDQVAHLPSSEFTRERAGPSDSSPAPPSPTRRNDPFSRLDATLYTNPDASSDSSGFRSSVSPAVPDATQVLSLDEILPPLNAQPLPRAATARTARVAPSQSDAIALDQVGLKRRRSSLAGRRDSGKRRRTLERPVPSPVPAPASQAAPTATWARRVHYPAASTSAAVAAAGAAYSSPSRAWGAAAANAGPSSAAAHSAGSVARPLAAYVPNGGNTLSSGFQTLVDTLKEKPRGGLPRAGRVTWTQHPPSLAASATAPAARPAPLAAASHQQQMYAPSAPPMSAASSLRVARPVPTTALPAESLSRSATQAQAFARATFSHRGFGSTRGLTGEANQMLASVREASRRRPAANSRL